MNKKDKYPRVGYKSGFSRIRGEKICAICGGTSSGGGASSGRVDIQINIFRGDDDVHKVCATCQKIYTNFGLLVKLGYKET